MDALFDALETRLASLPPQALNLPGRVLRESAVLVPLFEREGVPHILFTRRPAHLRNHADQFSFPGGRRDPEDATALHTALRETEEELGIARAHVRVLGMLDEVPTTTSFRIQPFVGVIPGDGQYRPNPEEVSFILEVPLRGLLEPTLHRTEKRTYQGVEYDVDFYTYNSHVVWGATARILRRLLTLVSEVYPPGWG
ncbi:CoA pyrophosphatase [Stigmatella aurantiaca]|uniref:Hydrolase, NUDIX family n=1 Tax=Stigmatella aurantiaca (strain DW4/3-1) TaxID=378806 RepID=Q09A98_STIAD|nr:CoA pyrophosphatase [Stigmatella aurantiaca]ADO75054.1 Hydrolase, NUDIX family [Stigmatella aurantiaca DW4/3-1]EAU68676.1 MutT/nudix family protein [Stigmatella aurantiaca DW4/3-1]